MWSPLHVYSPVIEESNLDQLKRAETCTFPECSPGQKQSSDIRFLGWELSELPSQHGWRVWEHVIWTAFPPGCRIHGFHLPSCMQGRKVNAENLPRRKKATVLMHISNLFSFRQNGCSSGYFENSFKIIN